MYHYMLKLGRSAGYDGITAEHLVYSHPVLLTMLTLLFKLFTRYSYVPDAFGMGMIIPLPKGDTYIHTYIHTNLYSAKIVERI